MMLSANYVPCRGEFLETKPYAVSTGTSHAPQDQIVFVADKTASWRVFRADTFIQETHGSVTRGKHSRAGLSLGTPLANGCFEPYWRVRMHSTSPVIIQQERSLRIMEVAARLFHEQGYEAVSLREIAKGSGISSGSLYHYIESKQTLLLDLMDESLSALLTAVTATEVFRQKPRYQLTALMKVFLHQAKKDRLPLALAYRELGRLPKDKRAEVEELHRRFRHLLGQAIWARCGLDMSQAKLSGVTNSILAILKSHLYDDPWLVEDCHCDLLCRLVDTLVVELAEP